jgi:membrane dipeptidase
MTRRLWLGMVAGVAAWPMTPVLASPATRSLVIDGNLWPPFNDQGDLDRVGQRALRRAGLSAIKTTLDVGPDKATALAALAAMDARMSAYAAYLLPVRQWLDIEACRQQRKLGVIYSFEDPAPFEGDPRNIDLFAARGVRVMQLSYNLSSPFGSGVLSPAPASGLTELGRAAVARMNALGVTVDLSHSDEPTSFAVLREATMYPVITHSGCAALHAHPRNKSDEVLRALCRRGGVIGIYNLPFLAPHDRQPDRSDYLAHVAHALAICGEDHVGVGSDTSFEGFDTSAQSLRDFYALVAERKAKGIGAPGEDRPPYVQGMNGPGRYEVIADGLRQRGYSARVVDKVLGGNWLRAFRETWCAAS